jgi:hypothetical protein
MDRVRCTCPPWKNSKGERLIAKFCPMHGAGDPDPVIPWKLNVEDRRFLRALRISTEDA